MKCSENFFRHLNEAKLLVCDGTLKEFPVAYSKSHGFIELKNSRLEKVDFIISSGESEFSTFSVKKGIYSDMIFAHFDEGIDPCLFESIQLFCPLVFIPLIHKKMPFIIAHMAQTLDGKICTNSGKSKWIGNDENLKHAHCLRAMVDGVLVGGNTATNDLPRLNVRHVEGSDPVRILLSNTFCDFNKLPLVPGMKTYLLRRKDNPINSVSDVITKVIYYDGKTDSDKLFDILFKLKNQGIDTMLVEGGPETISSFYKENRIDWLQLHIAPLIFGSGKSFIQLSEIDDVSEGRKLKNVFYTEMGDSIMMTGELN